MAFCEKCGAPMSEGAEYCPKCGQRINNNIVSSEQSMSNNSGTQPERVKTAQELKKMYDYFSIKQDLYDEYDRLLDTISKTKESKAWEFSCIVFGILFLVFGIGIALFKLFNDLSGNPETVLTVITIIEICNIILGIGLIIIGVVGKYNRKNAYSKACDRYIDVTTELSDYYKNYGYCMIGSEYTNPKILSEIADQVRQGRADTPKEAVNIMIENTHRNRMEMFAQQTAVNSAIAARAARSASRGANVSAVFCAANFFFK